MSARQVQHQNNQVAESTKIVSRNVHEQIKQFSDATLTVNQKNAKEKYSVRQSLQTKQRYDREAYLDQVAKIH